MLSGCVCDGNGCTAGFTASFAVSQCEEIRPFLRWNKNCSVWQLQNDSRGHSELFLPKFSVYWLTRADVCWWLMIKANWTRLNISSGALVVLICECWQFGLLVAGVAIVLLMLTWRDVCGSGADCRHKGPFHQTFIRRRMIRKSGLSRWNFTCNSGKYEDGPESVQWERSCRAAAEQMSHREEFAYSLSPLDYDVLFNLSFVTLWESST